MRSIYLVFKVGNNHGLFHMMPVNFYDPLSYGHTVQQELLHYSKLMKTRHLILRVDRGWRYKDMVKPWGRIIRGVDALPDEYVQDSEYRSRAATLDLSAIIAKVGDADLLIKLQSKNPYEIIDAAEMGIEESVIKDSRVIQREDVHDFNVITEGLHTIGTGKDFTLPSDCFGDMDDLTDDISATIETSVVETAQSSLTIGYNNHNLSFLSDTPHGGSPMAGHIITVNYMDGNTMQFWGSPGSGITLIDGIHFKWGDSPSSNKVLVQILQGNIQAKNIYMDGNGKINNPGWYWNEPDAGTLVNSYFWELANGILATANGNIMQDIGIYNCPGNGVYTGSTSRTGTLKNIHSLGCGNEDFNQIDSMTNSYLASSDDTAIGTAPEINLDPVDEITIDDIDANFGHPLPDSVIKDTGNTSHAEANDMAGVAWPGDGTDSTGPFQFVEEEEEGTIYWYRWVLEVDAQSCLDYINGLGAFPITGDCNGDPAPDNQKTIDWESLVISCTDGKFGFEGLTAEWLTKLSITQEDIDAYSPTIEAYDPDWIPE